MRFGMVKWQVRERVKRPKENTGYRPVLHVERDFQNCSLDETSRMNWMNGPALALIDADICMSGRPYAPSALQAAAI